MKRSLLYALLGSLCLMFAIPQAHAQRDLRIGVVDMQRAVSETREGKREEEKLIKIKDNLEAELNRKLKEFYEKEAQLRKAWSVLKEEEKQKRANDSRQEFEGLQKRYLEAERSLMQRKSDAMLKITNRLNSIITQIAQRDKFDYIFSNAAVLWAPRHVDITNEVIRLYDKQGGKKK